MLCNAFKTYCCITYFWIFSSCRNYWGGGGQNDMFASPQYFHGGGGATAPLPPQDRRLWAGVKGGVKMTSDIIGLQIQTSHSAWYSLSLLWFFFTEITNLKLTFSLQFSSSFHSKVTDNSTWWSVRPLRRSCSWEMTETMMTEVTTSLPQNALGTLTLVQTSPTGPGPPDEAQTGIGPTVGTVLGSLAACVMCLICICGNILVVTVVQRSRRLQSNDQLFRDFSGNRRYRDVGLLHAVHDRAHRGWWLGLRELHL